MCGINGIVLPTGSRRDVDPASVERMRDQLAHRGPDDRGLFLGRKVGLGHRRLSIVDLNAGHQPMSNEDGSLQIVFNGEIYNHAALRAELTARGHRYRTHCDTETILHLYEEHGSRVTEFLRGMFAFAIWDERKGELFLCRDRLGIKPLYYVHGEDGSLAFASEIKALLVGCGVKPELNANALGDYLANRTTSGDETLFRSVKRLLPGHYLRWRGGQISVERYWDLPFTSDDRAPRSEEDTIEEWAELFRAAVRTHLMADVPLGVFLSGGIDSSAIAALMSGMTGEPIKTFSVGFAERGANELSYARMVASTYAADHHEVIVTPDQFFAALPRLVWHEDEPLAGPASVPLYFVSRLAAQHVKVVLTGEGSDELLAGYERYRKTVYNLALGARYHRLTPEAIRGAVRRSIGSLPLGSRLRQKLARTFLCLSPDIDSIYLDNFAVFPRAMQARLLSPEAKARVGDTSPYAGAHRHWEETDAGTLLNRLLHLDTRTYLPELLMKQDQMSMAASIESRVPFLDHPLAEFSARLPERMKLRGWTTKHILRRSMQRVLPAEILRRPKMGFPVPIGAWFRGQFAWVVEEYVLCERARRRGLFDDGFVRQLVGEHQTGTRDHSERLWALVNLEIWARQFLDGGAGEDMPRALAGAALER